jgi:hypothetical protein
MKIVIVASLMILSLALAPEQSRAQIPVVGLLTSAIKKVITALDLKIQQLQNQTIALQNAEQQLENNLHLASLNGISGWLDKEHRLYQNYYQELARVKTVISDYDEVKMIISQQKKLLSEYRQASSLFHSDKHFSASELSAMENVYGGILEEGVRNLDEALLAVGAFSTQMDDAERMQLVHHAAGGMQTNLDHLRQYNNQNAAISYQRARDEKERQTVRQLYGLP